MKLTFGDVKDGEAGALPGPEGVSPPPKDAPKKRGRPPGSTSRVKLDELENQLKEKLLEELCVTVAFVSPLAAANVEMRAERTARAAVRLAQKNPAVRKGIERMLDGSDVFTLAMFPLTTAVCVLVDWGMMPANSAPARAAKVPHLWDEVYDIPFDAVSSPVPADANGFHGEEEGRGLLGKIRGEQ